MKAKDSNSNHILLYNAGASRFRFFLNAFQRLKASYLYFSLLPVYVQIVRISIYPLISLLSSALI